MPVETLPMPGIIGRRYELIVGWDCEYRSYEGYYEASTEDLTTKDKPNLLLSYQLAWKVTRGAREEGEAIWYSPDGRRPSFDELLALMPAAKRVLMIAHNGIVEVAHLAKDSRPKVMAIGKVPINFGWERCMGGSQMVQFRDTMLLAAESAKALHILSETNEHWKKCDLEALIAEEAPEFLAKLKARGVKAITRMDEVLRRAPKSYARYALHDSWATLEYYLRFQTVAQDTYGVDRPAMTAVGLSQGAFIASCPEYKELWGVESATMPDELGKVRSQTRVNVGRSVSEVLATTCFKGGLNTAYKIGWHEAPLILDVDMVGAYATAMATLQEIAWDTHETTKSLHKVKQDIADGRFVYAHLSFGFPKSAKARQTTLADGFGGAGLIYFLQGTCRATGVEIAAALAMGAKIVIHHAVSYAFKDNNPFAGYLAGVAARRVEAKKAGNKHGDLLAKLVGNGLYGKLGQGLGSRKTSRVEEEDIAQPIRQSSLTSPQLASYCTAIVRCGLADLVNCCYAIGALPLGATTDGAMIAFPSADGSEFPALQAAYGQTVMGRRMALGRRLLGDKKGETLVVKAQGVRALVCRTRVNALFDAEGKAVTGAWTGWRGVDKDPEARSRQMAHAFDSPEQNIVQAQARLPNPYHIYTKGLEYKAIASMLTLRVDSDFKRCLLSDGHTATWTNADSYSQCRKLAEHIHKYKHAATFETLTRWPKKVPRPTVKSALPAQESLKLDGSGKPPPFKPPARAKPSRKSGGGRTPRTGIVRRAEP